MVHIPITRTKTIMKTTDGADSISKEAVLLTSRATELFIKGLAMAAEQDMKKQAVKKVQYDNLVNVVHEDSKYSFLEYMIPKKITVKQYKELMIKKEESSSDESDEEEEETSSSSGNENENDSESNGDK